MSTLGILFPSLIGEIVKTLHINKKSTIYDKLYDDAKLRKIIKRNPSSKSNCILQEIIREKQNNNKSGTNFGDNF